MNIRQLVEQAERQPLADSDGKSGATLERAVLANGRNVIVKKFEPEADIVMRMTGDTRGREVRCGRAGSSIDSRTTSATR